MDGTEISQNSLESEHRQWTEIITPPISAMNDDGAVVSAPRRSFRTALFSGLVAGMTPFYVMLVCIGALHNIWIAMITMHGLMLLIMAVHCIDKPTRTYFVTFFRVQSPMLRYLVFFFALGALNYPLYIVLKFLGLDMSWCKPHIFSVGFGLVNQRALIAFGFYFFVVNPVVEECFWRIFLLHAFGYYFFEKSDPTYIPDELETDSFRCCVHPEAEGAVIPTPDLHVFEDFRLTEIGCIICAAIYASYHVVVVALMFGPALTPFAFITLVILGRVCQYLRNTRRYGYWAAVALHSGCDLGIALVILSISQSSPPRLQALTRGAAVVNYFITPLR